jgi:hypothetical protein
MNPDSAAFRRANQQPSYKCIPREEYLNRAYEFAHKKNRKFDKETVIAIRENRQGLTDKQQAEKHNVHPHTIYKIRHRMTYANI